MEASNNHRRQDLNDARNRMLKPSPAVLDVQEQGTKTHESSKEVQRVRKIRPERKLNIHDAIKISLGFMTNRRQHEVSEGKLAQENEKKPIKNVESTISTDDSLESEKLEEKYQKSEAKPLETFTDFMRQEKIQLNPNRVKISPHAPEFIPKHHQSRSLQNIQITESLTIPNPVYAYVPFEPTRIDQFQPSKLQKRLDRIRSVSESQKEVPKIPIEATHCNSTEVLPICVPSAVPKLSQTQLDLIAFESLSKLTHDQQSHLVYISNVPPKYFQEMYEYFVDYYVDVQCVNLDLAAVEAYLSSRGIEVPKMQPPKPFEQKIFSQIETEGLAFVSQLVEHYEEGENQTFRRHEEFELDQQIETMFNRRI